MGAKTDCFMRFSTVAGERGAADAERDIRGFACKFYTPEGNWDLVGNNTPTFFLRDAHNFAGLNRAVKRDPHTGRRNAQSNWDFWTMLPEALLQITITMSDAGIPFSFRHMDGFGEHTFSLYNCKNERFWCKFHFKTEQGLRYLTDAQAAEITAVNREYHGEDLYKAIEEGNFPKWKFCMQIMTEQQAEQHYENLFDVTKPWREKEFPLMEVGELVLDRNPENYFAEVEQAAFAPAHIVPGIGFSPDKLLQGRLFAYGDAQRYRLGVNHTLIPVNQAHVCVTDNHRDGKMRVDGNYGAAPAYTPNSLGWWQAQPEVAEPPLKIKGAMWRFDPKDDPTDDTYRAPGEWYRSFSCDEQKRLAENTARAMKEVSENIRYRHAARCQKADSSYGERIAEALDLSKEKVKRLARLPEEELIRATS